jgi:hypothetical protein
VRNVKIPLLQVTAAYAPGAVGFSVLKKPLPEQIAPIQIVPEQIAPWTKATPDIFAGFPAFLLQSRPPKAVAPSTRLG